jgi:hypothetical protein
MLSFVKNVLGVFQPEVLKLQPTCFFINEARQIRILLELALVFDKTRFVTFELFFDD